MDDEIKEKIKAYYIGNDIDKVLNDITNLQQENDKLLKENIVIKDVKYTVDEAIYKSRCEKAIEYIKSTTFFGLRSGKTFMSKYLNDLLSILQGENDATNKNL